MSNRFITAGMVIIGLIGYCQPVLANTLQAGGLSVQLVPDASAEDLSAPLQIMLLLTVLSLTPAILMMLTAFTRIVIVLSMLRQAPGYAQLPT